MFKNHPKGLPVLFFTEMWERFGFYLMLGIFFLYMTADGAIGGLGLDGKTAADIYGTYIALVYLTPFVGGLLADRIFGYRKTIVVGGILMGLGYLGLGIPREGTDITLWLSLFLIILGNGLFKPNISTLVGNIYNNPQYGAKKDSGFNIFYMGINIGAFVCNFIAAILRNSFGSFSPAFIAAGIGMFVGVVWFLFGQKHTVEADVLKPAKPEDESVTKILVKVFGPALAFALFGWFGIQAVTAAISGTPSTLFGSPASDAFLFACIPVVFFYGSLWFRAKGEDRERLGVLLPIFAVVIVFWAIFHQNGSALTEWARDYTNRELPSAMTGVADTLRLVEQVDVPKALPASVEGTPNYFHNIPRSEWPSDASKLQLLSTEIFQSVNPFFVVFLTPLVVAFFAFLNRRKKEPSTPGKIALGLFITALSTLVMIAATFVTDNGATKASALWLVGTYGVITTGELFLSPMGLSLVSKVSPARLTSVMIGGWFLSTSIGNKLSGMLSGLMNAFDHKSGIFFINLAGALLATVLITLMLPRLRRVMEKYTQAPVAERPAAEACPNESSSDAPDTKAVTGE
ncbi:MAG: peptide MFS transporter [Myxococcales bacterium]|jgi:POT family proton-dependent oligopeptide transporter|nr:peptide MFS transporter [Myxococcales bacterium]